MCVPKYKLFTMECGPVSKLLLDLWIFVSDSPCKACSPIRGFIIDNMSYYTRSVSSGLKSVPSNRINTGYI